MYKFGPNVEAIGGPRKRAGSPLKFGPNIPTGRPCNLFKAFFTSHLYVNLELTPYHSLSRHFALPDLGSLLKALIPSTVSSNIVC